MATLPTVKVPDGGPRCTCPLMNVTTIDRDPDMDPEFVRGDPTWCPRHDARRDERVAKRVEAERIARYGS